MPRQLALPYVPIDPNIDRHPKTRKLLRLLGRQNDPRGHWPLVQWLLGVGALRPDGDLTGLEDEDHADLAREAGDAGEWARALRGAEFIIDDRVASWDEYGGRVLAQRNKWKEDKKRQRGDSVSDASPKDVHVDSTGVLPVSVPEREGEQEREGESVVLVGAPGAIATLPDLEVAASSAGFPAWGSTSLDTKNTARGVLKAGAITREEWDGAVEATRKKTRGDPLAYALGVIDKRRTAAAEEATRPRAGPAPPGRTSNPSAFAQVTNELMEIARKRDGSRNVRGADDPAPRLLPAKGE